MAEKPVGKVEHYYPKVKAAAVRLSKPVKVGDEVHIVGHGDDFTEKVTSLQLDHQPIQEGKPGQSVGLWVKERVHEGDDVLLVTPEPSRSKPSGTRRAAAAGKRAARKASSKAAATNRARAKPTRRKVPRAPARKPRPTRKVVRRSKAKRSVARKGPGQGRSAARKASRKKR